MKKILLLVLVSNLSFAANEVHHPTPKEPKYLSLKLQESLQSKIPGIPEEASSEMLSDYGELLYLQEVRTEAQCQLAQSEVLVSLESFFGG
jgi:hypothetical protein